MSEYMNVHFCGEDFEQLGAIKRETSKLISDFIQIQPEFSFKLEAEAGFCEAGLSFNSGP